MNLPAAVCENLGHLFSMNLGYILGWLSPKPQNLIDQPKNSTLLTITKLQGVDQKPHTPKHIHLNRTTYSIKTNNQLKGPKKSFLSY